MALIDARGRVFGRVNLIDALVGGLVVGLVPLAYGAYALFHQPEPRILSVTPSTLTPTTTFVRVEGENLRPFLRVYFGDVQGVTFALVTPTVAEVRVPPLPAGTYDLVLYDVMRVVSRLPNAVTVEAPPTSSSEAVMLLTGAFVGVDDAAVAEVQKDREFTAAGDSRLTVLDAGSAQTEVRPVLTGGTMTVDVALNKARQIPALLRAACTVVEKRCQVGGNDLEPGVLLSLFTAGGRPLGFVVSDVLSDGPAFEADIRVRFVVPFDARALIHAGDRDEGSPLLGPRLATVTAVTGAQQVAGDAHWQSAAPFGTLTVRVPDSASIVDAILHLVLNTTSGGARYRGRVVKVGAPFVFETDRYAVQGLVLRVDPAPGARTAR